MIPYNRKTTLTFTNFEISDILMALDTDIKSYKNLVDITESKLTKSLFQDLLIKKIELRNKIESASGIKYPDNEERIGQ